MGKLKKNRKFIIVLSAALLLLAGAVWLNLKLNRGNVSDVLGAEPSPTPENDSEETSANVFNDYFNAFRSERSEVRAQEIDYLRSIINSELTDAEAMKDAQARLFELVSKMEKEFAVESQIRGKGFLDAAATYQGNSMTVIIDSESLSDEEVARILDIIMTETGLPASSIRISLGS
ncbi:MAG: SpoIIIAH-like family protein [Clostridia bacterium]|nr:SpoIIIAH-like family protein [Clostridia bacterium]